MTNASDRKTNWLAVFSALLALLLVTQTGAFLYFMNKKESPLKKVGTESERIENTLVSSGYPATSFASPSRHRRSLAQSHTYQDPWSLFDQMQDDMSQMMGGFMAGLPSMMSQMNQHMGIDAMPSVDMGEKDNAYIVRVDVPGLDKDKIEITVRGEILTIQGTRESVNQEQGDSYYTQERSYGSFSRSLRLPGPVDDTNVKADYQNGVLTITLPKIKEEQASKKISVA